METTVLFFKLWIQDIEINEDNNASKYLATQSHVPVHIISESVLFSVIDHHDKAD